MKKYLVVGAGLAGMVIAERLATSGDCEILVVERRDHIGGNCYDYSDGNDVMVQKYGPHAFHTNNRDVWNYLSKFTFWYPYFHKVRAIVDGSEVFLPFNLDGLYQIFPKTFAGKLEEKLLQAFGFGKKISILDLKQSNDTDIRFFGDYIYNKIFLGYSTKQWGVSPDKIDPSVIARVPVFIGRDNRHFHDVFQGIPIEGYSKMFRRMLETPNIELFLNRDFKSMTDLEKYDRIIFTGMIDEYFDFTFGKLEYRTLNFRIERHPVEFFQSGPQINYSENFDFTRICEYKYFLNQKTTKTTISYEYPMEFEFGVNEPFYPLLNEKSKSIYQKYYEKAKCCPNVIFVGRLAEYRYFNMDQVVERALEVYRENFEKTSSKG
ncbi:MAG: UDP-galactopyranose mutase [Candidatus Riflebacteria bacterium]|nr:UDP-galactopyranose mutase [Candidatus Riflebacteria bacterium]